jgi:hypothetical protein
MIGLKPQTSRQGRGPSPFNTTAAVSKHTALATATDYYPKTSWWAEYPDRIAFYKRVGEEQARMLKSPDGRRSNLTAGGYEESLISRKPQTREPL